MLFVFQLFKMLFFSSLRSFSDNKSQWASKPSTQSSFKAFPSTSVLCLMSLLMSTHVIFTKVQHRISVTIAQQLASSGLQVFQATQMLQTAFRLGNHCSQKESVPQKLKSTRDHCDFLQELQRHCKDENWVGLNKINS